MANDEHVAMLKQGVDAWNKWRLQEDLSKATSTGLCVICGSKTQNSNSAKTMIGREAQED